MVSWWNDKVVSSGVTRGWWVSSTAKLGFSRLLTSCPDILGECRAFRYQTRMCKCVDCIFTISVKFHKLVQHK